MKLLLWEQNQNQGSNILNHTFFYSGMWIILEWMHHISLSIDFESNGLVIWLYARCNGYQAEPFKLSQIHAVQPQENSFTIPLKTTNSKQKGKWFPNLKKKMFWNTLIYDFALNDCCPHYNVLGLRLKMTQKFPWCQRIETNHKHCTAVFLRPCILWCLECQTSTWETRVQILILPQRLCDWS